MVEKVMGKTRALIKYQGVMYKVVVQEILLYGSEIWVVPDEMVTVLEGFNNRISRRIAVMRAWRTGGGAI